MYPRVYTNRKMYKQNIISSEAKVSLNVSVLQPIYFRIHLKDFGEAYDQISFTRPSCEYSILHQHNFLSGIFSFLIAHLACCSFSK